MKKETYTQCGLLNLDGRWQVSWIPSKYAYLNKVLDLQEDGVWESGWQVKSVGAVQPKEYVESHEMDYRKTRRATDV